MIFKFKGVTWLFIILLLSTKLRKSQSLNEKEDEIKERNKRAAAEREGAVDVGGDFETSNTQERKAKQAQFERSQSSEDTLKFEVAEQAFVQARSNLSSKDQFETKLIEEQTVISNQDTPEFQHSQFLKTKPEAIEVSRIAQVQEFATLATTKEKFSQKTILNTVVSSFVDCIPVPNCNSTDEIYRRYDGSCNNRDGDKRLWGKALTPFLRLKNPPNYADKVSLPRISVNEVPLPSARLISSTIALDKDKKSSKYTLSVMQWGQFIDHDLTHTPMSVFSIYGENVAGIRCCTDEGLHLPDSQLHPECFPIDIPENDPFYKTFGLRCMNFVRSLPASSLGCTLGFRNQMNQISHYLDGSAVYGSSDNEADLLRDPSKKYLLKDQPIGLLPDDETTSKFDFLAGDIRCNEQPHLSVIHTIWLRQHNRVANTLKSLNPSWEDEKLFQETRRIIVAQIQHIVYNEWLPIILGKKTMEKFELIPESSDFLVNSYLTSTDASIINEFAAVAFRFGHSLVQGVLELHSIFETPPGSVTLSDYFNDPAFIFSVTTFEHLLNGLVKQPIQNSDQCIVDDLTNKLFKTINAFGLDLAALNIQRGRDHGIGTYSQLRNECGMKPLVNFDSIDNIDDEIVQKLKSLYESVHDVDAFIAGISEKAFKGGILGELFNCIISMQFFNLKYGDRFYYEHGDLPSSFKLDQLNEIRKTTWARIICDNSARIKEIQPEAFRLPKGQTYASCTDYVKIPTVNLNLWQG